MLLPVLAFAQIIDVMPGGIEPVSDINQLVVAIQNISATVFGAIAVVMFVIAGIMFLTAQGNPEKVQAARSAFLWGIAGVVVGIIAFSIIAIVRSFL